jgi:hypothetical protein
VRDELLDLVDCIIGLFGGLGGIKPFEHVGVALKGDRPDLLRSAIILGTLILGL